MSQTDPAEQYRPFALTEVQESFYVGRTAQGGTGGTRIHLEFETGPLDTARLEESWNRLVADTGMLRAHLLPDARQTVRESVPAYRIPVTDLTTATTQARQSALEALREEAAAGIDPHSWPLFAVRAATLPGGRTRVLLTVDELIADGPSVSLLLQDWYARYATGRHPAPPAITFRDYALATTGRAPSEASLAHWRDKLAPVDFARPTPLHAEGTAADEATGAHRRLVLSLEQDAWSRAKDAAKKAGATPSALLLALTTAAVQAEATTAAPLPVILTTYNRRPVHPDVPRLVGPFLSTSVFVAPAPAGTLGELLDEVRGQLWQDLEHGEVSGVRALREHARTTPGRRGAAVPLVFTSLLGSIADQRDADPGNWAALVDIAASATHTPGVALEMCVQERDGALHVSWDCSGRELDEAAVRSAFGRLENLLRRVADDTTAWQAPAIQRQSPAIQPQAAGLPERYPLTEVQSAYLVGRLGQLGGGAETRVYQEFLLEHHDVDALEAAWNRLVAHHPMLRAAVHQDGTLEIAPLPADAAGHGYRIARHDLTGLSAGEAVDRALAEVAARLREGTFPLGTRPMYALEASTLPDGTVVLHVVLDALLADARSFALLFGQLFALHDGDETVLDTPADPRPHLHSLAGKTAGEQAEAARQAWREKFAVLPGGPPLPEPAQDARRLHRRTPLGSWQSLTAAAAAIGVPADMVLLTAYTDELRRAFGDEAFTVTVVSWDRPAGIGHADGMVADFTQLAWVVVDDTLPEDFAARARELWARCRADLERGEIRPGLAELRTRVFRSGGSLRLPVVFTRVPEIDPRLHPKGVSLRSSQSQTAQVALDHVPLLVGDELIGQWDAAEGSLETVRLDAMFDGYAQRVRSFVAESESEPEPDSVSESVSEPAPAQSADALPAADDDRSRSMAELIGESLRRNADRTAVRWNGRTVGYRELDARTARLAHRLADLGVRPGDHVAVHMDRSDDLVAALVGIVRAGAVYVPVDPANPPERVRYLLEDSGARVVVADAARAEVAGSTGVPVLCQDRAADRELLAACPETAPEVVLGPEDPVYTIYTSGTTGKPKGCRNTHQGFVNRVLWMQDRFPLGPADRVAQKTPYGFDVSAWEFFWPLLAGASIVVARPGGHVDPGYLARLFRDEKVTVTHFVPSVLGMFLRHPQAAGCTDLRYVFASGEALPVATMRHFFEVLPGGCELHNLYGPTEAAIDVTHWACRADWSEPTVPIGRPISHTTIHLVDEELRPVPDGTPGEIVIGGRGVALGYHERPELTAERFVASPFPEDPSPRLYRTGDLGQLGADGEIRYLGRIDSQFKLRGLRIEPEEIEAALTGVPGIAEARVLPLTDEASGEQILAAVCVPDGDAPAPSAIRTALSETLPAYLVPSGFRFVGRLPLTANGKLDRPAAGALFTEAPASEKEIMQNQHSAPQARAADFEEVRAAVAACLGVAEVAPEADLFDLGATSFTMIRLAQEIERLTGVALPVDALINTPTAAGLYAAVAGRTTTAQPAPAAASTPAAAAAPAAPASAAADPAAVAAMAAELMGVAEVDADADLFDLGATSFTMIRLAQLVGERFGADVPVDVLIQAPTARAIAAAVAPAAAPAARPAAAPARAADVRIAFDPAAKAAFKEARIAERRLPAELVRLPLPQEGPEHQRALYDASSFRDFADGPLPAEDLLDLLATLARGELDGRGKHRYPSAGGFYPVQVYLYVSPGAVAGIDGGLHYLHPGERTLVAVDPAARMGTDVHVFHNRALVEAASFGLFLVSTPAAIAPAYGQANAARFSTIEAGHIAQLLLTAAPQRGLGMCAVGEMNFDAVRGHFGLDDDQELLLSLWGGQLTGEARERRAGLVAQEQRTAGAPAPAAAAAKAAKAAKADRAVAVIGFAARLPGADTLDELDALLADGRSATGPVPSERWAPLASRAGRAGARVGGYLADVTAVEAEEFGLGDEEAAAVDPQERLLLSVARHCFENASVTPRQLSEAGSVGVFVGSMWQDHALYGVTARADGRPGTHATRGGLAHRTSHAFGLTGPSLVLDTGCVSGLAAVEAAYRAVADGRCEAALAAGSNLVLHPDHLDVLSDMGLVAEQPDSCAMTDRASGWIVGEGVGAVLLKPLDRALADGDPIHAVLRGGALVHSGTTRQFGIPDPKRQEEVMRAALADASLTPGDIGYVEAAAAGAALADVLEFGAVDRLFTGQEQRPVPVGSVKPNTGHLEAASVFAQLGKLILQFRREELYPTRLTSAPNPALNGRTGAVLAVSPEGTRWRTEDGAVRRALVNGFAGGGSYGSLVVEEPPRTAATDDTTASDTASDTAYVLPLSADNADNLARLADSLAQALDRAPHLTLPAVARSLREGRTARAARAAVVADRGRSADALRALAQRIRHQGPGIAEEWSPATDGERTALDAWLAGAEPQWPAVPGNPRRAALPAVPLDVRHLPLPVPAPASGAQEPGTVLDEPAAPRSTQPTPFDRLARITAEETGRPAERITPADDLFAMGATSRQLIRIAARVTAEGGRELSLETLFTAPDLGALAVEAFPVPATR
ncbi:amino acid adenylation domain-containing protein [Streptomyces sp. NPDC001709]